MNTANTVTVAAVGDICGSACNQTDDVVAGMGADAVITAGDNAYNSGTRSEFDYNYDPYWGRFNDIVHPSPGNHEYYSDAVGYDDYYRDNGVHIGDRGEYYYSFDLGEWHIVSLNSNIDARSGSAQERWLRQDLERNTKPCTMAYWHHPRFSTGGHGDSSRMSDVYEALTDYRADVVVSGHDHSYERFAPATVDGTEDAENGLRQFVIGTGGRGLYSGRSSSDGPSEVFENDTFGVGRFELSATGYSFTFEPVSGRDFTDRVSGECHNANQGPDFGLSTDPAAVSVRRDARVASTVSVAASGGFGSAVDLAVSGLPDGVTGAFEPSTVTPPAGGTAESRLTLAASATAPVGEYTATVTGTSGELRRSAELRISVRPGGEVVFADDFESDRGWRADPAGTDTASTGHWERGIPEQTRSDYSGQLKQLGSAASGWDCLSTGRRAGFDYGEHDVDDGTTSIASPAITLPAGAPALTFAYSVGHGDNSTSEDHLRLSIREGGTVTTVFEREGAPAEVEAGWQRATVDLSAFAGREVGLLFEAADAATPSLFEAQVDDIEIRN
ncbi:hypothetical protein GCM10027521_47700 [Amycolatopsis cihanbeyliensis]